MTNFFMEGERQQIALSVPLFLRKLWRMVNDQEAEDVIGWNATGDGFIIYDQLRFITKLLPKYFKHNNMASFIRQLNFYDFHKVAGIDKDEMQFAHSCFLKDLPETLVFIRRKCASVRSKLANAKDEELSEILSDVKELKSKHAVVDNELKLLKQENGALWNEVNNLRLKHAKQTKIINKIIHFLISYMHSHQNSFSKAKGSVGRRNSQNLKTGPTILELDYHDGANQVQENPKQSSYTLTEPGHSGAITYPSTEEENLLNGQPVERTLDEILNKVGATNKNSKQPKQLVDVNVAQNPVNESENLQLSILQDVNSNSSEPHLEVTSLPGQNIKTNTLGDIKTCLDLFDTSYKMKREPVQSPVTYNILQNPEADLGLYLDSTQVELNSLQEMLNNLTAVELTNISNSIEYPETESLEEAANVINTYQGIDSEPAVYFEGNLSGNNEEYVNSSLVDQFTTSPDETNAVNEILIPSNLGNEEYSSGNMNDVESDNLVDKYFA